MNSHASGKTLSVEELVEHLIGKCKAALENGTIKVAVADLVRIRAFREEMAPRQRYGKVTWVDRLDRG